jgi:hypothetical protein
VRVSTTDVAAYSNVSTGERLLTVASGATVSIPGLQTNHPKIQFDVERPNFSDGSRVQTTGLRGWCAPLE